MLAWENEKKKQIAEESPRTQKMRAKLKKKLALTDQKITPQALKKTSAAIHQWIARHAGNRAVLKTKAISLFDANQNAAKLSQRVSELAAQLQTDLSTAKDSSTSQFWATKTLSKKS